MADQRGWATPDLERLYSRWADGEFGLIVTGAVMVDHRHLERPGNVVIDGPPSFGQMAALRSWASSAKRGGAQVWAQLSHAGARTHRAINPHPLSASAATPDLLDNEFGSADAMIEQEIQWAIEKFASAARVCKTAGFTGVQIHAGHGYLISSFLSPTANQRTDKWGGSPENRARLLSEVVGAVRARVGDAFPMGIKLNLGDFQDARFGPAEVEQVARIVEAGGVDLLELAGGSYETPASVAGAKREFDFLEPAKALRRRLKTPILVTGGLRSHEAMQAALSEGFDMLGVARPACVEPDVVRRLLGGEAGALESCDDRLAPNKAAFGWKAPFAALRATDRSPGLPWYYAQLYRLGRGEPAAPDLTPGLALREVQAAEKRLLDQRARQSFDDRMGTDVGEPTPETSILSPPTSVKPHARVDKNPLGEALMPLRSLIMRSTMRIWYSYVGALNRRWPTVTLEGKTLTIFPGVYKPLENEAACVEYCEVGDRVLDLGCGSGVCSVFCAPKAREVVAVDISAVAVKNTDENCRRFGLQNVTAFQSDMFSNVEGRFDLILANAPYIAADFEDEEEQFATSVRYLPTLFAKAREHLTDEGRLLVQFPLWSRKRIASLATRHGLEVVAVRRMPRKSLGLALLSLVYLQVGFRSAYFLIRPLPAEPTSAGVAAEAASAPRRRDALRAAG